MHNSVIRRTGRGISFAPASGTSELYVADTVVAGTSSFGIHVQPSGSGSAKAVLDRVRVENTLSHGISFTGQGTTGSITATVRDSVSAGNGNAGIRAEESGGGTTTVMVERSASVNNLVGIRAETSAGATVRIGDSTVNGNGTGLNPLSGGAILSYGTNKVDGNDTDGNPTGAVNLR